MTKKKSNWMKGFILPPRKTPEEVYEASTRASKIRFNGRSNGYKPKM